MRRGDPKHVTHPPWTRANGDSVRVRATRRPGHHLPSQPERARSRAADRKTGRPKRAERCWDREDGGDPSTRSPERANPRATKHRAKQAAPRTYATGRWADRLPKDRNDRASYTPRERARRGGRVWGASPPYYRLVGQKARLNAPYRVDKQSDFAPTQLHEKTGAARTTNGIPVRRVVMVASS